MIDPTTIQFDAIYAYLAHIPRDPLLSLSAQILRDAAWCELARRIVAAKTFETPAGTRLVCVEPAPIPSVALTGKTLWPQRNEQARRRRSRLKQAEKARCLAR